MKKNFIISCFLAGHFFILQTKGQVNTTCLSPVPDNCSIACNLGTLPAPMACTVGDTLPSYGDSVSFSMTNVGGIVSNPYSAIVGCASPAVGVWYKFTATGTQLMMNITSAALDSPNVSIYQGGNCNNLAGQACYTGSGGQLSVTFQPLTPDSVYYLQISGGSPSDVGNFTLTLQNNLICANCLLGETLTATPPPTNGSYAPGQTVNFCFSVTNYNQTADNWLHGVALSFGSGWDISTLTATTIPPSCATSSGAAWGWYQNDTSNATGNIFGVGFYYETSDGAACNCIDNDPGDNFGDAGVGADNCFPMFCWKISTQQSLNCSNGTNLQMSVKTLGDYLSGSWTSPGCTTDPTTTFAATVVCCQAPTITTVAPACNMSNGKATAKGNGIAPWTYTWKNASDSTIQNNTTINGPDVLSNLAAGQYFVTVTDASGCSSSGIADVGLNSAPTVTANNTGPYCVGQSISLSSTAGNSLYRWSGPGGYSSTVQNPVLANSTLAMAGTYTVTITNTGGCTASASTDVVLNQQPAAAVAPVTAAICQGQDTTLTATGGISYLWSDSENTNTITVNPASSTTYTVTVTAADGCTATAAGAITINSNPVAGITPQASNVCTGQDTTLTASGGVQYVWSNSATTPSITISPTGSEIFSVTVTDAEHCTATATALIRVVAVPAILPLTTNASCYNGNNGIATAEVFYGTPPYQYHWTGNGTVKDSSMINLTFGPATVTVTDANNCTTDASFAIGQPPQIVITTITQIDISCSGGTGGYITISASGGYPLYSFAWSNNEVGQTDSDLIAGTYVLTVTDANSCQVSQTFTITQPNVVASNPIATNVQCFGAADGYIDANPSGGTPPYMFQWSDGQDQQVATALTIGSYDVTVTDQNGCSGSASATLSQPTDMSISTVVTGVKCLGQENGTILVSDAGGTPPYDASATQDFTNFNFSDTGLISDLDTGWYWVVVSDFNGCTKQVPVYVPNADPDSFSTSTDSTLCYGPNYNDGVAFVTVLSSENGPYQFSIDGGALQSIGNFYNLSAGPHTIYTLSAKQCTDSLPVIIFQPPPIETVIVPDTIILPIGQSQMVQVNYLNAVNPTYSWNPDVGLSCVDCPTPFANGYESQVYTVTLSVNKNDTTTCYGSATLYVNVVPHQLFYIPNAFTPNGDGNDDVFTVYGETIKNIDMKIFNRWGELVYQTNNMFAGWDGTYKGQLQLPGVFVYIINIYFLDNTQVQRTGSVTLIR